MDVWQYRAVHPDSAAIFDRSMSRVTERWNADVMASYPFSNFAKIVDIGGGDGSLMISILQVCPRMRGVVVDLPRVAARAKARIAAAGMADRCEFISGDAFQNVPTGGDAYILSRVIHNWNDQRSVALLGSCSQAMSPNAKLLLIERHLPARVVQSARSRTVAVSDLGMMVMTGGCERTETQYRALLAAAGFTLTKITPTESGICVMEGRRWV
jgi:ubiquinone/menaquinone biosynthesis C-methylase UbiE